MKSPVLLPLTMAALLLLAACHKNSTSPSTSTGTTTTAPKGPYLYVGGTNYTDAIYWKISLSEPATPPVTDTLHSGRSVSCLGE